MSSGESSEGEEFESVPDEMQYTFHKSDLPMLNLDVDKLPAFLRWKEQWQGYRTISGLSNEQGATQVIALKACFEGETLTVVNNLGIAATDRDNQQVIVERLEEHLRGNVNHRAERHKFFRRKQHQGETIADFVVSLRELAASCRFHNEAVKEDMIVDALILGCRDQDIEQELLKTRDLTLGDAITRAQGIEQAKVDGSKMRGEEASVNIQKGRRAKQASRVDSEQDCQACGLDHRKGNCPARNRECRKCQETGHFAKMCTSGKYGQTNVFRSHQNRIQSYKKFLEEEEAAEREYADDYE